MKSVILYARVSTKEQGKSGLGLEAQIEDMTRFAERNGLAVVDVRKEVVSGKYDLDRRPILKMAFADAAKKKDCFVLTSKIDRLSRKASFILNLMDRNVKFMVAECGVDASPLEIQLRASFGEEERRKIAERTKSAFAAKRRRGEPMGMHIPSVRFKREGALKLACAAVSEEADSFAEFMKPTIMRMRKDGMSVNAIADELNLHGFKTQRGGKWWAKSVSNIMARWA